MKFIVSLHEGPSLRCGHQQCSFCWNTVFYLLLTLSHFNIVSLWSKKKQTNKQKTATEYLAFYQLICSGQNGTQKTKRVVLGRLPVLEISSLHLACFYFIWEFCSILLETYRCIFLTLYPEKLLQFRLTIYLCRLLYTVKFIKNKLCWSLYANKHCWNKYSSKMG